MPSPLEIITDAYRDIQSLGAGKTLPGEDLEFGLRHYNRMVGYLQALQLGWYEENEAFPWAVSQQSYTIGKSGSGADFEMTAGGERPPKFDRAKLAYSGTSQEVELPVFTVQEYSAVSNPAQSAIDPIRIYYQPTFPNGTLWPVPYPTTTSNSLRLFWKNQLSVIDMADVATDINIAPGVHDALVRELSGRLAPAAGKTLSDDMKIQMQSSWQVLLTMRNADPAYVSTEIRGADAGSRSSFNPNTLRPY